MVRVLVAVAMMFWVSGAGWAQRVPACTAAQLSAAVDSENGNFDATSHSGTLLVLRNIGTTACSVTGYPALTFQDAAGNTLAIAREVPKGMHPGPVDLPVRVVPSAEVTATLRWVGGDVYSDSGSGEGECLAVASVTVQLGNGTQTADLEAHFCGLKGKVTYQMTRMAVDPR